MRFFIMSKKDFAFGVLLESLFVLFIDLFNEVNLH